MTGSPRRRPGGLQLEIVASLFVVMLAGLTIVAVVMAGVSVQTVREVALGRLELGAAHLERFARLHRLSVEDVAAFAQTQETGLLGGDWWVLDGTGRLIAPSPGPLPEDLAPLGRQAARDGDAISGTGAFLGRIARAHAFDAPGGRRCVLLGVVSHDVVVHRFAPLLASLLWVLAMAAGVFVGFGSYLLRQRIVQPLRAISATVREMARGDLGARTEVAGSDEIAELARGFNEMAASLARERDALVRAQESLLRSQRLASVGQLAAGVAHEVGNPVAAMLGYAELLLRDTGLGERSRDAAERIRREALRVRALVHELLNLARPQSIGAEQRRPRALLEHAAERMRPQPLLQGIELVLEAEAELPDVITDARRVDQILGNLIENAAHALRGARAPRIELAARLAEAPARLGRRRSDPAGTPIRVDERPAVMLSVRDNGPGIDPEVLPHVFDPFFTTKEPGEGTGLGLWNAHRWAESLGGRLEVETAPGTTRFSLILPSADTGDGDD